MSRSGTSSSEKRIISPGIDESPSRLESDIIYVTFSGNEKIDATIESNIFVSYHHERKKRFEITGFKPEQYDVLLEELIRRNNGVVDYHRAKRNILEPIFKAFMRDLEAGKVIKF